MRRIVVLVIVLVLALGANAYWIRLGWPVALPDTDVKRIACVSYAPYREPGETPFDPHFVVSAARIDADLAALSQRFACVRTYSVSAGLDQVPAIARKYGMTVYLGVWLSRSSIDNERELAHGIEVARANHDSVRAVVVGNEVLLRGELPQETLAADIRRVRDATGLPVTYADVWEFWLKYPRVGEAVSFVTIHILPYWEDEPVPIEDAVRHVREIRARMQSAFPGRDILIGESGWPSQGRQRRGAIPSLVNQARFVREFLNWADANQVQYNLIEAFDQPWKRQLEGTVGGYWGLYDQVLRPKFGLTGVVVEWPEWKEGVGAGALCALAALAVGVALLRRGALALAVTAMAADAAGAAFFAEWRHIGFANRDLGESALTFSLIAVAIATTILLIFSIAQALGNQSDSDRARLLLPAAADWRRAPASPVLRVLGVLRAFWLAVFAVMNLLLVFDARYRDFPSWLLVAPVMGFALIELLGRDFKRAPSRMQAAPRMAAAIEEKLLAGWAIAAGLIILVLEEPANGAADLWVLLGWIFALATLWPDRPSTAGPSAGPGATPVQSS